MTVKAQCVICGSVIESTTVTKTHYKKGEHIDTGCPHCGQFIHLVATETVRKRRAKKK